MKINQNAQIGDIYRIRRGNLNDAINHFNLVIKNIEINISRHPISEQKVCLLLHFLHNFNLSFKETDVITLSYCKLGSNKVLSIDFTISQASKVEDSVKFYDAMLNVLEFLYDSSTICGMYSVYLEILSAFDELKKAFIPFADL